MADSDVQETSFGIPKQNVPADKKTDAWARKSMEGFLRISRFEDGGSYTEYDKKKLYEYYSGHIDKSDYQHVISPFGKERKNVPSKIRNYNIIKPNVDYLLGEKSRRPLNDTVVATNSDSITQKEEALKNEVFKNLRDRLLADLQKETEVPAELDLSDLPAPQEVKKFFLSNYTDQRSILGQKALNFIKKYCELRSKFRKAWYHFVITGEAYTYRDVVNDEPYYEVLNPLDVDYDKDPNLDFVEDGDWAIFRRFMYPSTIVEHFHKELTDDQLNTIETETGISTNSLLVHEYDRDGDLHMDDRLWEVYSVFWKARKKIGFVSYIDEFGEPQQKTVDEYYEVKEGETVEWDWIDEVWEGHKIGHAQSREIYVGMRPKEVQRRSRDNPARCKLPVNGRMYSDVNTPPISVVSVSVPYQILYNAYRYRLEVAIAKSKDIIGVMDINAIPSDWSMDKFMHFVDTVGIMWVDYSEEGINLNPQQQSVLDLSIKTIDSYISLLHSIKQELEELLGISRQRKGQTMQYEGKAVAQQSIVQSSYITEDLFNKFAELEQRDEQALIDYSQLAWLRGKKTTFVMPDATREYLEVDPEIYCNAEYGVFVSSSGKEVEKLQTLKALSQQAVAQGTPLSAIADMLDSENVSEIKNKLKQAEQVQQQLEQAQIEAKREEAQTKLQAEREKMQAEDVRNQRENQTKIEVALIEAENERYIEEVRDQRERDTSQDDTELAKEKLAEEKRHNKAEESIDRIEARIKRNNSSGD